MPQPTTHTAPAGSSPPVLGKTLPQLLYEACDRYDHSLAFNQPTPTGWAPFSLDAFRLQAEETALGLLELGLERGEHVAFFMESDVYFCLADMGCLLAGLIDVPIYLSSTPDVVQYIIEHAESRALVVSDPERLAALDGVLPHVPGVTEVILATLGETGERPTVPDGMTVRTLEDVRLLGRARRDREPDLLESLRTRIQPHDLATLIYTSGTTGRPKGVMLTHENISFNAMTAFAELKGYHVGPGGEVAVSFLPLTHIFARALHYGYMAKGTSVYFTTPTDLVDVLREVRPTGFATVPRMLEKVYGRIQERMAETQGLKRKIGAWALALARSYETGVTRRDWRYMLADRLVFSQWRQALGGRVRFIIAGGAALNAELTNVFAAAGIPVLQGYGLTETSPVIAYNRPQRNRAGTVGDPLPGVEVRIAEDGEILTRGPHVMQGYFKEPDLTHEVLDEDGWFHTGDIGEFNDEGALRITDRKKSLFKLSTGKYVMPQPLENRLSIESLVEHVVVVGAGYKFCTALIFPDQDALRAYARSLGLPEDRPIAETLRDPQVIARYQVLVDRANEGMDHWSTIKRFALIPEHLTVENGLLTPTLKVKRPRVRQAYEHAIAALYEASPEAQQAALVFG